MQDAGDHFKVIERAVLAGGDKGDAAWRTESWARCLHEYKLDPSRPNFIDLSPQELKVENDIFDNDIALAGKELEATLSMIEGGGYSAHIANSNGVIISERRSRDSTFYCSSDRVGAVWSERVGGTNGIGTALAMLAPAAVYLADHLYADLTGQACAAAPFFGPDGQVLGIINLSTQNPGLPQLAHRVVAGVAQITAHRLENRYFRDTFRKNFILTIAGDQATPAMVAFDADYRIVGATRAARALLRLDDSTVGSRSLWGVFEKSRGNPTLDALCETVRELRPLGSGEALGITFQRPTSMATVSGKNLSVQRVPLKQARRIATLAECAGNDPQMKRNLEILRKVFGCGLHLLLLGETGVGKDTLSRALHQESERGAGPFVAFNCSAVPESLIDSELFGYSSGAFTGANKDGNAGRIVEADKGTLFLDEIGDMPLALQTRLLRFLETQEVMPLGSGKARMVDVQIIAATHQNLAEKVSKGTFRQDLFYRLAGTIITVPPLRERTDLDFIIETILEQVSEGKPLLMSVTARAALLEHDWPGNIRELRNVLTRAARLAEGGRIELGDLMISAASTPMAPPPIEADPQNGQGALRYGDDRQWGVTGPCEPASNKRTLARDPAKPLTAHKLAALRAEREEMARVIEREGDVMSWANALGMSRATFYRKVKQHQLSLNAPN
ncbi:MULTISPECIES: sigma-54-dependent Fis family transcriptional regulator [unclassified Mesorhizobium]|uniref:sigma-54-dependent Fis family transcriptional regulator n=1 Tax=unclassified Mesorhizobium TaxID=325217 RepID=UPI0024158DDB|nr:MULTISPECIES: sigma-54-dependent Fis family transcriptional regulator [unclassified Mesorhizobium]MDG4890115.1 sigma-54-dependent Fis family transcriptional regulator [Mesorhizobium sp. WSM4887]MDG4904257.1 sigma-54-dependent Fis family transcriptional regulator [Mesorhizobium sp. WSM4962]MDG4909284.1 sigma-54-dependent Fis family transcriptional regulator [Mesorhizobium sp. WSM4898]MDG4921908.1 sigma-54-dependent Fis family transcriptional regulator [Mesorhizobium sp. WSM4989]